MQQPEFMQNLRAIRVETGMSQADFWGAIGISQSVGSKLETKAGKKAPAYMVEAIRLRYVVGIDTGTINQHNVHHVKLAIESAGA
jgi:predicted transcriptional regulator